VQWFNVNMVFILLIVVAAYSVAELTANSDYDFTIGDTDTSKMVDAIDLAGSPASMRWPCTVARAAARTRHAMQVR
jgi:hypothetical protein